MRQAALVVNSFLVDNNKHGGDHNYTIETVLRDLEHLLSLFKDRESVKIEYAVFTPEQARGFGPIFRSAVARFRVHANVGGTSLNLAIWVMTAEIKRDSNRRLVGAFVDRFFKRKDA